MGKFLPQFPNITSWFVKGEFCRHLSNPNLKSWAVSELNLSV